MPVIVAGRIRLPDLAERALEAGQADFVGRRPRAAGRPGVGREGARRPGAAAIRPCIGIVQDCRRYAGGVTCTINPRLGREAEWPELEAGDRESRRVVVAGGGPAGLEAARVAAEAGHSVVLFERGSVVGGQLRQAAAGPTREELLDFVFYLERELDRLGVDVRLGAAATSADVVARSPTSSSARPGRVPGPPAFGVAGGRAWSPCGICSVGAGEIPKRALVIDDGSGFWQGISAAEFLAERGAGVELVTPARAVGLAIPEESVANVHRRLRSNGVRFRALSQVARCRRHDRAPCGRVSGEPSETAADLVAVVSSLRVEDGLVAELAGTVPALVAIGDCAAPSPLSSGTVDGLPVPWSTAGTAGRGRRAARRPPEATDRGGSGLKGGVPSALTAHASCPANDGGLRTAIKGRGTTWPAPGCL